MKKQQWFRIPVIFILGCTLFIACKKGSDEATPVNPGNNNSNTITSVPSTFTQKLLIEQFTGAWNGGCPDGIYRMDQLVISNSNKVIGVNIHMGDAMEIPLFNSFMATFNNNNLPQFPSAMVNRIPSLGNVFLSKTQWASNASVNLGHTAVCGLAIKSSVANSVATIEVHAGFKAAVTGTYHLTVYLVENSVTGTGTSYDQVNTNTSNDNNSPYYNKPTPIQGFIHNNVVRKILTADLGDAISASSLVAGGEFVKSYTTTISGTELSRFSVVACINKVGNSATTHEIMNVQKAAVNTLKNWD